MNRKRLPAPSPKPRLTHSPLLIMLGVPGRGCYNREMFKSLYQARQTEPATDDSSHGSALYWPATYQGSLAQLDTQDWSLTVSGAIEKPTRFIFRNILALPQTTQERRLISADGWSVKAQWQGVLLEEIIKRIKPYSVTDAPASAYNQNARLWVHQENASGQRECLALDDLLQGRALLCHKANGKALPPLFGGPVALLVFDRYHYKGLGQITSLTFSWEPTQSNFNSAKGHSESGEIVPGDYYAFDLKAFRPLRGPENID